MKNLLSPQHKIAWLAGIVSIVAILVWTMSSLPAGAVSTWNAQTQITAAGETTTQAPQFLSGSDGSITAISVETVSSVSSVLARRSSDGGSTWGLPLVLSTTSVASSDAAIVRLNNGVFAVAWAEASGTSGVNEIRLRTSSDDGATWTQARIISSANGYALAANKPHLAAFGATDVAVGFQQSDGFNDIAMFRTSFSSLQNWNYDVALSASTHTDALFVTPVVNSNGDMLVSWVSVAADLTKEIFICGSSSNWQVGTILTTHNVGGIAKAPVVVALPTGAFVALWADPTAATNPNYVVTASKTSDAGANWDDPVAVSSTGFPSELTAIVTPDGGITAAWAMETGGYTYIESSYSSPSSSPSPSPSSSPSSSSSSSPSRTSTGAGSAWSTPVSVSPAATGQYYTSPHLSISPDGTVAMVLNQVVNSTYSSGYAFSTDNGVTWPDGVGSLTSWQSSPTSISDVSLSALTGQGFVFGWQTLNNNNPNAGFARVYGWVPGNTVAPTPTPSLATTGISLWVPGLLALAFFGSGFIFWAIKAHSLRRR